MEKSTLRLIFFGVILLSLLACNDSHSERFVMNRIETLWQLSDRDLESAIEQTELLSDSVENMSDAVVMKYILLTNRLRDKQFIKPSSADTINKIVEYYNSHGENGDKVRAYHYLSSAYRDLQDIPRAITSDLTAIGFSEGSVCDTILTKCIYSQLVTLYRRQFNFREARKYAMKAHEMFPEDIWTTMDLATVCIIGGDSLEAMRYFDECYEVLRYDTLLNVEPGIHAELLYRFTEYGNIDKANNIRKLLQKLPVSSRPQNYDMAMGCYAQKYACLDSAIIYYSHRLESAHNYVGKCDAASKLMDCYYQRGDNAMSAYFAQVFKEMNDSVIAERKFELTNNALTEFQYYRDKDEEQHMKELALKAQHRLLIGIVIFIICIFGSSLSYVIRKNRYLKVLQEKNATIGSLRDEINEKSAIIVDHKQLLANKEALLRNLDEQLQSSQRDIEQKILFNNEVIRQSLILANTELDDEIKDLLKRAKSGTVSLSEHHWQTLFTSIDRQYPEFLSELQRRVNRLSIDLMKTAYLMKAGVSNPDIEKLMDAKHQTVWARVNKIRVAMGEAF